MTSLSARQDDPARGAAEDADSSGATRRTIVRHRTRISAPASAPLRATHVVGKDMPHAAATCECQLRPELAWLSNMTGELSWEWSADPSPRALSFWVQERRKQPKSTGPMSVDKLIITRRLQTIGHQMTRGLIDLPGV